MRSVTDVTNSTHVFCSSVSTVLAHEVYAEAYLFVRASRNRKSVSVVLFAALVIVYHT